MPTENKLDLSQISVSNLLNPDAADPIPDPVPPVVDPAAPVDPPAPDPAIEDGVDPPADPPADPDPADPPVAGDDLGDPEGGDPDPEESSVIDILREKLGYEVQGEFKEDYDGVVDFTKTVAEEIAKEQLDSMFSQFPDVEQYIQFRYNGGDPKNYFAATAPSLDYNSLEIGEEDISTQRMVVEQFMVTQGYPAEEITETIQEYVAAGILKKHADRNLGKLQARQKQVAQDTLANQQLSAEQGRAQVQAQWQNIRTTIDAGQVRGFQIPQSDKNKFFSWMSDAVDGEGRTQRSLDRDVMDVESQVAMEYLLWKKFDLNKLVSNTQNTKKAQNLKTRLQKTQTATTRMKGGPGGHQAPKTLPSLKDLF